MQETTNYKLKKLELTDSPADITVLNGNWDTIDAELKEHEGSLSSQAQSIAEINAELDTKYDKAGGTISGAVTVSKGGVTVTGNSTFNNDVTVKGTTTHENPIRSNEGNYLQISVPVTRGTKPSSTLYSNWSVYDQNGYGTQNRLAHIDYKVTNASVSSLGLYVNKYVAGGQEIPVGLSAGWAGEEPQIVLTHTPPTDSDDKSVATTEWVRALKATAGEYGLVKLADETALLSEAEDTALSVSGAYRLNDFRRKSTAYALGDTVSCAFNSDYFLECTKAGTTKNGSLDTRNVTFGQVITDGTCKWTVRRHLKGINGELPDENGNIEINVDTGNLAKLTAENTFTKTQNIANTNPATRLNNSAVTRGTKPSATKYWAYTNCDADGLLMSRVRGYLKVDGTNGIQLTVNENVATGGTDTALGLEIKPSGGFYAYAPMPADTANGNEIVTAAWANSNLVNLTGAQTVKGNKTFSGTVTLNGTTTVSKTPTDSTHVANKKYVDDKDSKLVNLTGAQTVKGNKTFSGTVTLNGTTTVSKTPTDSTHVANKKYVDDVVVSKGSVPTGTIIPYMGQGSVPSGYLLCNGAQVSRTTYANLFKAIGTKFGSGNGSTTFTLPNLNGRYLQGTTSTPGSAISAGLPNISGELGSPGTYPSYTGDGPFYFPSSAKTLYWWADQLPNKPIYFSASRANSIYGRSSAVVPSSYGTQYLIKY